MSLSPHVDLKLNVASAVRSVVSLATSLLVFCFSATGALAQTRQFGPGEVERGDVATIKGFEAIFSNIITVALEFAGIVLFIMFLIGGFKYLTAGGDPKAVEAAKGTLTHAIIGLVVLILAFIILQLIHVITGVDVTTFRIYK